MEKLTVTKEELRITFEYEDNYIFNGTATLDNELNVISSINASIRNLDDDNPIGDVNATNNNMNVNLYNNNQDAVLLQDVTYDVYSLLKALKEQYNTTAI